MCLAHKLYIFGEYFWTQIFIFISIAQTKHLMQQSNNHIMVSLMWLEGLLGYPTYIGFLGLDLPKKMKENSTGFWNQNSE